MKVPIRVDLLHAPGMVVILNVWVGLRVVEQTFKYTPDVLAKVAMRRLGSIFANTSLGHWFLSSQYESVFSINLAVVV
jgi:hypothetical protein